MMSNSSPSSVSCRLTDSEFASNNVSFKSSSVSKTESSLSEATFCDRDDSSLSLGVEKTRSEESGGGSLCSANVSSDEEEEDEDDSFIIDDDDSNSSCSFGSTQTSDSSQSSLTSPRLQPATNTIPFRKADKMKTFFTEIPELFSIMHHSSEQSTPEQHLLAAVELGDLKKVSAIIQPGVNTNAVDKNGRSAMHIACSLGHSDIVELLLGYGFSADTCSLNKQTPLHEACIGGHCKVLRLLLSEVSDLDMVDNLGRSAAHYCTIHGESQCLELLCTQGCDVCLEDFKNRTGVHFAAMNNHQDVVRVLVERGADIDCGDREGKTPAHYAARYGSLQALEMLLTYAVEITQGDSSGSLPSHDAAYHDKLQCLKILIKKGAKSSLQDDKGRNVLHKAAQGKAINCLHWLLSSGRLEANSKDFSGNTGLHYAAANGFSEGYYCLLQHGATQTMCNADSETPLDTARKHGKSNSIKKGADGYVRCDLCDSLGSKDKQRDTMPTSLLNAKEMLFRKPNISMRTVSNTQRQKNLGVLTRKNSSPSRCNNHVTLAAKYYGPSV